MSKRVLTLAMAAGMMALTLLAFTSAASAAGPPHHYKAIAWAPSTNTIPYVGKGQTRKGAERRALRICRKFQAGTPPYFGQDCRGTVWVFNGWLAFYSENLPSPAGAAGWSWAPTKRRAKRLALRHCIVHHGNTCKLRTVQGTQPFIAGVPTRGAYWK